MKDTKNRTSNSNQHAKRRRTVIIMAIIVALLVIFDLSPFGGNARFYATWIGCAQKPVAAGGELTLGSNLLHYKEPAVFQPVRFLQPEYFCTPLEAEQAGYSASPTQYEFPHLKRG